MNKRYEEKIQSMIRFEDSTLKEIRDYAEKYKSKLDRLGLKYSIDLWYFNPNNLEPLDEGMKNRPEFEFGAYICYLQVAIHSENLSESNCIICHYIISALTKDWIIPIKRIIILENIQEIKDYIDERYNAIIEKGFEYVYEHQNEYSNKKYKPKFINLK